MRDVVFFGAVLGMREAVFFGAETEQGQLLQTREQVFFGAGGMASSGFPVGWVMSVPLGQQGVGNKPSGKGHVSHTAAVLVQ